MKTVEELTLALEQATEKVVGLEGQVVELTKQAENFDATKEELSAAKAVAEQTVIDLQEKLTVVQSESDATIEALKAAHVTELESERTAHATLAQEFETFKQIADVKIKFADETEKALRLDTERVYQSYAALLKSISETTMQTRLRQIKEDMSITELQENRRVWSDEIDAMLAHNGDSKHIDKKDVDKNTDGVYGISKPGKGLVR